MRILYLSPWFPYPLDTGSRIRVYYLMKAMSQRHQVTLLTLDAQGWAPAQVDAVASLCEHMAVVPQDPFRRGRWRTATRFFSLSPVVTTPISEMTRLVQRLHVEQPFEVVMAASTVMAPYTLALPGVLRVLEEHNSNTRWMYDRYHMQTAILQRMRCWASWRKSALYESHLFPRFDFITMVSAQDADVSRRLLRDGYPPVEVLPNGVDCGHNCFGLAQPMLHSLIFNGALTYSANYDAMKYFLVEIYPLIRRQAPDVSLTITGSTSGVDLSGLQLDENVHLSGYVGDVRALVAGASACVVPIREGGGTRLKILEAMALGTPVVATAKGAEGLDVTNGEHLLLADTPMAFADHVLQLLRDSALRQQLVTNARRLVEQHYDWTQIGQRFVNLVEDIASRRAGRGVLS